MVSTAAFQLKGILLMILKSQIQIIIAPKLASLLRSGSVQSGYRALADCFVLAYGVVLPEAVKTARDEREFEVVLAEVALRECARLLVKILEPTAIGGRIPTSLREASCRFFNLCAGLEPCSPPPAPKDWTEEFIERLAAHREECERELIAAGPAIALVRSRILEIQLRTSATWKPADDASDVSQARRQRLLSYLTAWRAHGDNRSERRACDLANVHPRNFRDWKKGLLKSSSVMCERIEKELENMPA